MASQIRGGFILFSLYFKPGNLNFSRNHICRLLGSSSSNTEDPPTPPKSEGEIDSQSQEHITSSVSKEASQSIDVTQSVSEKSKGFLQAFEKFTSKEFLDPPKPEVPEESFPSLFRKSALVELGDPIGKVVTGTIYHVVNDDLYVDFGWKFHCVVPRPTISSEAYVRNATVRLRIRDLELSTRFLGATEDLSLNEADCSLLGLVSSPLYDAKKKK